MISVLYVDDEPMLLELGKHYLEKNGRFCVDTVSSALDAIARMDRHPYDVIVSDYQMPGMDGIGFLQETRSRFGDIPFILFTGRGREEVVIQAINNGADFYLQKGGEHKAEFAELEHKINIAIQRRNSIRSVRESESRFSKIFNTSPILMMITDLREGTIIDVNESFLQELGFSRDSVIGNRPDQVGLMMDPDEMARIQEILSRAGEIRNIEFTVQRPSGEPRTVLLSMVPIRVNNNDLVFTQVVEITERKQIEEALKQKNEELVENYRELERVKQEVQAREEQFREFFNNSGDAITIHTLGGLFLEVNDVICRRLGYSREEFLTMGPFDIDDPENRQKVGERLSELKRKGHLMFRTVHIARDGTRIPVEVSSRIIEYNQEPAVLSTGRDISNRAPTEGFFAQEEMPRETDEKSTDPDLFPIFSRIHANLSNFGAHLSDPELKRLVQETESDIRIVRSYVRLKSDR